MKEWAKSFYKGAAWRKCRQAYFVYQHGLCERCGGAGKIVHHKNYLTPDNIHDPAVSLSFNNLELLCQQCHNREHHERYSPVVYGLSFDVNGNLVRREEHEDI
jgi:5-methylcytosine-specific restriction endonuclease McrA